MAEERMGTSTVPLRSTYYSGSSANVARSQAYSNRKPSSYASKQVPPKQASSEPFATYQTYLHWSSYRTGNFSYN